MHRKGSHIKMKHPDGRKIVFPIIMKLIRYTLKGALKDAGISIEEFCPVDPPYGGPLSLGVRLIENS